MSNIPKIFGYPLWYGKIKNRVAKKYLHSSIWRNKKFIAAFATFKEGDLILNCSSFNVKIAKISPWYRHVSKGYVLSDIDITDDKGGFCSVDDCMVRPAISKEEILSHWEQSIKYWSSKGDPWNFVKRYEFTTVLEDGQAVVDYDGLKQKYGI